jgi:hypothetical protein
MRKVRKSKAILCLFNIQSLKTRHMSRVSEHVCSHSFQMHENRTCNYNLTHIYFHFIKPYKCT